MSLVEAAVIPQELMVPNVLQNFDDSLAGSVSQIKRALVIGIGKAGAPQQISSASQARALLGEGSSAANMAIGFMERCRNVQCWVLPVAEPSSGAAALWDIAVSGSVTANGAIRRRINGQSINVALSKGDDATVVIAKLVAAINSLQDLVVEASTSSAGVVLMAKYKGEYVQLSCQREGQDAAGIVVEELEVASTGVGTVAMAPVFAQLDGRQYQYFCSDLFDTEAQRVWTEELNRRYGPLGANDGRLFAALSGELGNESSEGSMIGQASKINCPHIVLLPRGESGQDAATWSAIWAAEAGTILSADPAANTLETRLNGLQAGRTYTVLEREAMLYAGIASYLTDESGETFIERLVTSYNRDVDGNRITSYLDVQVVETLSAIRALQRMEARKKFKKWKLASTKESFGAGAKVMNPDVWQSFLVSLYSEEFLKKRAWVENLQAYKESIRVQVVSKSRLEWLDSPVLIGQFYIAAGNSQFQ